MGEHETVEPLDRVHEFFELSYAQYLTIPRSVLQSMPQEWQNRFVTCLEELDETIEWRPSGGYYWVELRTREGRFAHDPLRDYERGRRRVAYQDARRDAPMSAELREARAEIERLEVREVLASFVSSDVNEVANDLEALRQRLCGYCDPPDRITPTCDCKFPSPGHRGPPFPGTEVTGCPELREAIRSLGKFGAELAALRRKDGLAQAVVEACEAIEAHKEAGFPDEGPAWLRQLIELERDRDAALAAYREESV